MTILSRVIGRGLDMSGRSYTVTLDLHDKPGELMGVATIVARLEEISFQCFTNVTIIIVM